MNHEEVEAEDYVSTVVQFVLLEFSEIPYLQGFLSGLFSIIYMVVLTGNSLIIIITRLDPALHKSMYFFFLANFSILEICYVLVTLPRIMIMNLGTQRRTISLVVCATQMCVLVLGAAECFLLAVMAYDCYVAICNPLQYPLVMTHKVYIQLVAASWISGIPVQVEQTLQVFSLPIYSSNIINHFFCDIPPVLKLACGEAFTNLFMVYMTAVLFVSAPYLFIFISYIKIISTVLKLPSATSRVKAFSTCSCHLTIVLLFLGTSVITYIRQEFSHSAEIYKVLSLFFYAIVPPMFNPMMYCLRSKDVKGL
uniref:G-protein coupled receptors family 1 profile domain-containing protein n=1 Tax=Sciurus vulgaris TaxID=55149 RepID=A0A8D2BB19_SCIVU